MNGYVWEFYADKWREERGARQAVTNSQIKRLRMYQSDLEMWKQIQACSSFDEMNVIFGNHGAVSPVEISTSEQQSNLEYYQAYAQERIPELEVIIGSLEWEINRPNPLPFE